MITNFPNGISSFGIPLTGGSQLVDMSGTVYFVDGNFGSNGNDGLSWDYPKKTLAATFTTCHADIARGSDRWARRNTIFIAGDRFVETLAAAPQKTDVIGVGSCDNFPRATIRGNHAPINAAVGTRWINVGFEPTSAAVIMTLTSASNGMEFHNCQFQAWGAATATTAIKTTAHAWLKIVGCSFDGAFSDTVIDIAAGDISGLVIKGNSIIGGAQNGIEVTGTTTVARSKLGLIADNYIQVAGFVILDGNDNTINVIGNRCISAGAGTANAYEIDEGLAVDNVITYNDGTSIRVPIIPSA